MRQDTAVITTKGICYFLIGVFTPWSAALGQWIGTGEWPGMIVWLGVIVPASIVGGSTQLLAFLSGSYGSYVKSKEPIKQALDAAEVAQNRQQAEEDTQILAIKSAAKVEAVKAELKTESEVKV